jgi:hypothetical protein
MKNQEVRETKKNTTNTGESQKDKVAKALVDSIAKEKKLNTFSCIYSTVSLILSIVVLTIVILK